MVRIFSRLTDKLRRTQGMTLVEVLTVAAATGVIVGAVLVLGSNWQMYEYRMAEADLWEDAHLALQSITQDVRGIKLLDYPGIPPIEEGSGYKVFWDENWQWHYLFFDDPTGTWFSGPKSGIVRLKDMYVFLPDSIDLQGSSFAFDPDRRMLTITIHAVKPAMFRDVEVKASTEVFRNE